MREPLLQVSGLRVAFGAREVLRGVEFSLEEGEAVALLGPNGSGKSTCLNAISGFAPIVGGTIRFAGRTISGWPVHRIVRAGVVQVSQSRDLFPDLSVADNLELGAFQRHRSRDRTLDKTRDEVYQRFPRLADRRKQLAGTLSGGERQMLALGRALMGRPKLLMLDEPSLGLAPLIVREIFSIIVGLRESGVSILLVEQNARAALQVSDEAYVLETGELVLAGPSDELAANPRVAATYLGQGSV